jgi:serine/threonine protein kinase
VVHRDLKPSNILVTADGAPKLLDFGIARIMRGDGTPLTVGTQTGLGMATPEYASLEQLQGLPPTTLSVVYSLGVVLYELLSGQRPYRFASRQTDDVARAIAATEPLKPSEAVARGPDVGPGRAESPERLRRRLRGDLDNIVLMAIRKEPERRYPSVERLSEDITRHLDGRPVLAREDALG